MRAGGDLSCWDGSGVADMGMNLDELERLHRKAVGGDWRNLPSNMLNEIWEAFPALLALARDGERYRWLREHTSLRNRGYGPEGCWLEDGTEGLPWNPEMERKGCSKDEIVDAAIDAARKGERNGNS